MCLGCIKIDRTCSCLLSHLLVVYNACGYNSWKLGIDLHASIFTISKAVNDKGLSKVWIWPEKLLQMVILLYSRNVVASLSLPLCIKPEARVNYIAAFIV